METTIRLPGFTAEAALGGSGRHLPGRVVEMAAEVGLVVPAAVPHWGDFKDDYCRKMSDCNPDGSCVGNGLRQFSAILWDIPWGVDWKWFCENTVVPAVINGQVVQRVPDRCVHSGFNMWGEFDIPDPTCPCGTGYQVCMRDPLRGCNQWVTIFACSEQQARAGCAAWPGCVFNGRCIGGRCY